MTAPDAIYELVSKFEQHRKEYQTHKNETELRREFLDPFFEALGWDVFNKKSYSERFKEVAHEISVEMEGQAKAADYAFRVGDKAIFFVEAKKPSVNIGTNPIPAFQLRRYGWSAKLPISILTDFEQLAVYECRTKPSITDKASFGRINLYHYSEYVEKWDEIAAVFSHAAVMQGAFEKFVENTKGKKGTEEVDDAFLKEIERWRDLLARNIALRNPNIQTEREMNFAVQMIIDRIIFLRIGEDRGIEPDGQLQQIGNGKQIYTELIALFRRADTRYNSGLFHFADEKNQSSNPDTLTPNLQIDDKVFKDILHNLYYPDSPYVFTYISADILGQVYEQFLGKVIRLTAGHQAKVEEKPEVRKAGGVYYTPTYIVDYIVKNTLGKLLEGKTPKQAASLKVLDPACGSGSFLLGAYQYLLDWHVNWYSQNEPEKWARGGEPVIYQTPTPSQPPSNTTNPGRGWKLTTPEKKRILLDNIHGVDIDTQAVEVTKLSLLLKVLEGESGQLKLGFERVLPDLGNNIQCGNSLIGPDFYEGRMLVEQEERYRVNAFDWQSAFPQVFQAGGFDVVIGNPPWISLSGKFGADNYPIEQINYLVNHFQGNSYMPNMYEYFVAQGLILVKNSGYFSYIVPDRLGFNRQFIDLRKRILNEANIISLVYKVPFPGITADTLVFVFQKGKMINTNIVNISEHGKQILEQNQSEMFNNNPNLSFGYYENAEIMQIVNKIASANIKPIKEFCDTTSGFGGKSNLITEKQITDDQIQTLKGESIGRYELRKIFWFEFKKKNITGRTTDTKKLGASPRILLRKTGDRIIATYDESQVFPEQSLYFLFNKKDNVDYKYLLGILNSRLLTAYFQAKSLTNRKSIAQVKKVDLDEIPICVITFLDPLKKVMHDKMVVMVESMLELHRRLPYARTPQEKEMIQREIESTDGRIDRLVYELYGLTEEEIRIVEGKML